MTPKQKDDVENLKFLIVDVFHLFLLAFHGFQ